MKKKSKKHAVFRYIRKNLTVILLIMMVLITVGTFAWFSVSNSPRVQNLALVADHAGNLQIADDLGTGPGTYGDVLDLATAEGADYMESVRLSPVTTTDGATFYAPNYDSANTVSSVTEITDHSELINTYIYEKSFYLKASSGDGSTGSGTSYEVALVGPGNGVDIGSYILRDGTDGSDTAAYAVRISFTVNGNTYIYEPNCEVHNTDTDTATHAVDSTYGKYSAFQQNSSGVFLDPGTGNSKVLFTIQENVDTKVTMRVWLEGTDDDCANSVGATMIKGQIQFISNEVTN
ncbi:MAG: hypothetical protein IJA10_00720 [Lachnospiraceae bacterium]|nr:hypothetical protein [Lachnospiraceae bacterium]